jgi:hypothetical protein
MKEELLSEADLDPRDIWPFDQVQRETKEFEQILCAFGITIASGSPLESLCFSLLELKKNEQFGINSPEDLRITHRPAFGLYDLVRRIVRLHKHQDFPVFVDHLKLLNTGTVAQNIAAPADQVAAKIFELFLGLVCLEVGTDTRLDGPVRSYGDNPDVLVTLAGRRWGFACKVPSGKSPVTAFDRLEEGIGQIEDCSAAEIGCVVFNLKNYIDHDQTWPLVNGADYAARKDTPTYGYWIDLRRPIYLLRRDALEWQQQLVKVNGLDNVRALFTGKKSIPGAILFLQTTTGIQLQQGPVNTVLGLFELMNGGVSPADAMVLDKLNDAMHHH